MVYDWVQGRTLHFLTLKNLDLETHFTTEAFPEYSITQEYISGEWQKEFVAIYNLANHDVKFSERNLYNTDMWFTHVYFHELMHSTSRYNDRMPRMWAITYADDYEHFAGLEERIADIAALVLCQVYDTGKTNVKKMIEGYLELNQTKFALPWQEVVEAVYCYAKNKNCPKLKKQLQYVKQTIVENNLTDIYEGKFNGQ